MTLNKMIAVRNILAAITAYQKVRLKLLINAVKQIWYS